MRIHYLQHVPFETPGYIAEWVHQKGHTITGTHLYNYERFPDLEQFDWLIILGGPMNIYEEQEYPWLADEKQFIKEAIANRKAVLGICLGAQLIADVLGGEVTKNPAGEIGWLPVELTAEAFRWAYFEHFPETFPVFQWHNDTFSILPAGAFCLAESEACSHQAFIYSDRVIGFQFHLESSAENISALMHYCAAEMKPGIYQQNEQQIRSGMDLLPAANSLMREFLDQLEAQYWEQGG